ncbi:TRM12 [Candida pseudojiufengensis]|uniref:TRM12 n=1 Tax=Candida pseudojiufengensis TaxID=497109 RepID=UPI0022243B95|nr:TRM12 [Candida pseudojiufengensis]KAI5961648.1 TRM12 [Candida pseudojiufengensis]
MIRLKLQDSKDIKPTKTLLEDNKWLNKTKKIENDNNQYHIYTTLKVLPIELSNFQYDYYNEDEGNSSKKQTIDSIVDAYNNDNKTNIKPPKRWSIYPPMLLFNDSNILESNDNPKSLCELLLENQQEVFGTNDLTHIAINKPILETNNIMRKPLNILPIYGDFGPTLLSDDHSPTNQDFQNAFWCHVIQNGIYQTWAPKYTMFSRGNIKEKKRILDEFKKLQGTVIIDFYCGIGYFSLSYLKNGGKLLCWELNPWSIEGFRRSLEKQGYKYKIVKENEEFHLEHNINDYDAILFLESNEKIPWRLRNLPNNSLKLCHINLGLLPTSKPSWSIAKNLISEKAIREQDFKTIIHVHENVHVNDFEKMKLEIESEFNGSVIATEKIKTFAPDVWHVVFDVEL